MQDIMIIGGQLENIDFFLVQLCILTKFETEK